MTTPRSWSEIEPADARDIQLPREDITGPVNELGEVCPWPWEPQQLVDAPLGQYHCPYCGGMVVAGVPHPDWTEQDEAEQADARPRIVRCDECDQQGVEACGKCYEHCQKAGH